MTPGCSRSATAEHGCIAVDASVLVDALAHAGERGARARASLRGQLLAGPDLLRIEAAGVLRKLARNGDLSDTVATHAVDRIAAIPIRVVGAGDILLRVWELRHNLTGYDAAYVAAAEHLSAPLVTRDSGLAGAPGTRCEIRAP